MNFFIKISKTATALFLAVSLAGAASQTMAQNLILNGNFATGNFTGWSASGSYFAVVVASYGINPPNVGDQIVQADGNDTLSQTFGTAVATTLQLNMRFFNANGDGLLTDISVSPVPEPSSLALGALGLGGLMAVRRQKRI